MAEQSNKYLSHDIVAVPTNYDFSDNADKLKAEFAKYLSTMMIDAQSPHTPRLVDIIVPNTYYPGLWKSAVEYAITHNFKWLMFIASDLQIPDVGLLCKRAAAAVQREDVGIYSASLSSGSRCTFTSLFRQSSGELRESIFVEGFFFLARVELLAKMLPIPPSNIFGWGLDVTSSYVCYQSGKIVVVDDGVEIFHPERQIKHKIDDAAASVQSGAYVGPEIYSRSCRCRPLSDWQAC